jgi:hypothetical protein
VKYHVVTMNAKNGNKTFVFIPSVIWMRQTLQIY